MKVRIVSEKDRRAFNNVAVHPLQSWEWGEFRREWGNEVVRLGVYEKGQLVDGIQVIFSKIPHTSFKIGTVIKSPEPSKEIIAALKELGKREKAIFIKLEPSSPFVIARSKTTKQSQKQDRHASLAMTKKYKPAMELLRESGCVPGKTLFTPTSFWIDLTPPEEDLLKGFSPKTRYNIRLAQRRGVKIIEDNSDQAFEVYLKLMRETVERQGFYAHTKKYHRLMWQYLHKNLKTKGQKPIARLLTARHKGEMITCWIVFVWHDFLYYPYGASSTRHKNVMANNLMMWEAVRYGRNLKLKTFDLWGREPGKGFTKFKEGYNPEVVEFLGTWDLVTSLLYFPYRLTESIRWKILRVKNLLTPPSF